MTDVELQIECKVQLIEEHCREIYVRENINSAWVTVAIAELPGTLALKHAFRILRQEFENAPRIHVDAAKDAGYEIDAKGYARPAPQERSAAEIDDEE